MRPVTINTDSLRTCHKDAASELENLKSGLVSMRSSVDELNETWEGTNHGQFVSEFEDLYASVELTLNDLGNYLSTIIESAQLYESCDSEIASYVSF